MSQDDQGGEHAVQRSTVWPGFAVLDRVEMLVSEFICQTLIMYMDSKKCDVTRVCSRTNILLQASSSTKNDNPYFCLAMIMTVHIVSFTGHVVSCILEYTQ